MKTIFRISGLAVLTAAFVGVGATATFAQDNCADADGQAATYAKFTELYPKTDLPTREEALSTAKSFVEKYGACEPVKEQNDYFKKAIPAMEAAIAKIKEAQWLKERFDRFDAGIKANNADDVYAAGKEILSKQPENINIIIPMGVIGSYQSTAANNYKYTDDGLRFANLALSKIKAGVTFPKPGGKAGAFQFEYTKPEAENELNYAIAYLSYYGKKDKTTALPLYYQLSQNAPFKDDPRIYGTIGDYYVEQRKPLAEQIRLKIAEQQKEGEAVEVKEAREDEIKKLVALFNGYNERILDAYGRAYKVTKDTPANKAYRDNLYKIMADVYKSRFDKDTGLDAYISQAVAKPFPNPTSEVTPVTDPDPAKATTSTTTGPSTAAAANTTAGTAAAKPAAAAVKPGSASGKTAVTTKPKK